MLNQIYLLHKSIIYPKYGLEEINEQKNKTICHIDKFILTQFVKSIYFNGFYFLSNFYYLFDLKNRFQDKKYINQIIMNQDLDMSEVRNKTNKMLDSDKNNNLYSGLLKWISGICWSNALITNGYESELDDLDKEIIYSINRATELVEPIERNLTLFHGFEKYSYYGEENFISNTIIQFPGILSKTSKFQIANQFAQIHNFFQPKFLVVFYPLGSKHIGLDIKPPKYDEYEYISKPNEKFKIIKICRVFDLLKFQLKTFYICSSLDY
jgi:hypothetical protein